MWMCLYGGLSGSTRSGDHKSELDTGETRGCVSSYWSQQEVQASYWRHRRVWGLVFGRAIGLDQLSERTVHMRVSLGGRQLEDQGINGTARGYASCLRPVNGRTDSKCANVCVSVSTRN